MSSPVSSPDAPYYFKSPEQAMAGAQPVSFTATHLRTGSDGASVSSAGTASTLTQGTGRTTREYADAGSMPSSGHGQRAFASHAACLVGPDGYLATGNWYMAPHLKARARQRCARDIVQRALVSSTPTLQQAS